MVSKHPLHDNEAITYSVDESGGGGWLIGACAVMATGAIFMLLPLSDIFTAEKGQKVKLRQVETASLKVERHRVPEQSDPEHEKEEKRKKQVEISEMKPPQPSQNRPEKLSVQLKLDMPEAGGDFSLDFTQAPVSEIPSSENQPDVGAKRPSGPFELKAVDSRPRPIRRVRPTYPYSARRRGTEGYVRVQFVVDREGQVENIRILSAENGDIFNESVRAALNRWKFKPGQKDGRAVPVVIRTTFQFRLEDE